MVNVKYDLQLGVTKYRLQTKLFNMMNNNYIQSTR